MKTMNKTLAWLVATVLTLTLVTGANAESSKQRSGKVVRIKGDARYSTGNKIWQPLKVGTVLRAGNVVQTAPNSFVDIVVNEEATATAVAIKPISVTPSATSTGSGAGAISSPDQDVIRVLDDTYLVFDSLSATDTGADTVTETLLDLKKGSIFGNVKKQAAASRFEVKIPNGVAGIRGTIFLISASGNIACMTGSVVAAYTDSSGNVATQVVGAGQQFNTNTGESSPLSAAARSTMEMMTRDCSYAPGRGGPGPGRGPRDHDRGHDFISRSVPEDNLPQNN
jgi:hypothetical protein